jgi:hypothetical protein
MLRSGHVKDVKARAVYTKEHFRVSEGLRADIEHDPIFDTASRGELMAFYAVAFLTRGGGTFEVMTKEDVDAIRARARSKDSDAWKNHYVEMGKKTAIRRLAKRMPQTPALHSALTTDDRLDTGELLDAIRRDERQFAPSRVQGTPQRSLMPATQAPLNDPTDVYSGIDESRIPASSDVGSRQEAPRREAAPRSAEQLATAQHVAANAEDPYEDRAPNDEASEQTSADDKPRKRYAIEEVRCPLGTRVGYPIWMIASADLHEAYEFSRGTKRYAAFTEAAESVLDMRANGDIPEPSAEDLALLKPPLPPPSEGK